MLRVVQIVVFETTNTRTDSQLKPRKKDKELPDCEKT